MWRVGVSRDETRVRGGTWYGRGKRIRMWMREGGKGTYLLEWVELPGQVWWLVCCCCHPPTIECPRSSKGGTENETQGKASNTSLQTLQKPAKRLEEKKVKRHDRKLKPSPDFALQPLPRPSSVLLPFLPFPCWSGVSRSHGSDGRMEHPDASPRH